MQLDDRLPCSWRSEPILLDGQRLTYGCEAPGGCSGVSEQQRAAWAAALADDAGLPTALWSVAARPTSSTEQIDMVERQ